MSKYSPSFAKGMSTSSRRSRKERIWSFIAWPGGEVGSYAPLLSLGLQMQCALDESRQGGVVLDFPPLPNRGKVFPRRRTPQVIFAGRLRRLFGPPPDVPFQLPALGA